MAERVETDICVIGAGSGGLSVAAGASQMGADVVLIEGGKMGGDCLNYGCVPSKSMIAAAGVAESFARAPSFGIGGGPPAVDFAAFNDHVHQVIAAIAPHDSVARFEGLGVRVIRDWAHFVGPTEVAAGDLTVAARRIVIATGSSAAIPPIPGIDAVPFFTNETIFDNRALPGHLIVIGAGPIGMELAQAHRRLGAEVTVLEIDRALVRDDPDLVRVVVDRLGAEGVDIREGVRVARLAKTATGIAATIERDGTEQRLDGTHLLIATGRTPNVERLALAAAGVAHGPAGIVVDGRLRTTNKKVFAIGDVAGGPLFTHVAGYHAGIVIRNALFRLPSKVDDRAIPWVTYTDPELAGVGLSEDAARKRFGPVRVLRWPLAENDRAQAERRTEGLVKVIATRRGRILGASIAAAHAGELIQPWVLALSCKLRISAMANLIAPYPTLGEINKRVAGSFYTESLFSPRTRAIVRLLRRFG